MRNTQSQPRYEIGMVDLGVMGRNLKVKGLQSLGALDAYRSAWLPANLIPAQRDYFGAHTYERNDAKGTFQTEWEQKSES